MLAGRPARPAPPTAARRPLTMITDTPVAVLLCLGSALLKCCFSLPVTSACMLFSWEASSYGRGSDRVWIFTATCLPSTGTDHPLHGLLLTGLSEPEVRGTMTYSKQFLLLGSPRPPKHPAPLTQLPRLAHRGTGTPFGPGAARGPPLGPGRHRCCIIGSRSLPKLIQFIIFVNNSVSC